MYISKCFIVFVISMLFVACVADVDYMTGDSQQKAWGIQVMPKTIVGDVVDGVKISSLRIIIADYKHDGLIIYNGFSSDKPLEMALDGSYRIKLQSGKYKISVIANERTEMTSVLNTCTNINTLNSLTLKASTEKQHLVFYKNQDFTVRPNPLDSEACIIAVDGNDLENTQLNLVLDKLSTKISLHITKQTINPKDQFEIIDVQVLNVPEYGFLIPNCQFKDSYISTNTVIEATQFVENGEKKTILSDLFLPEYIKENESDITNATLLSITALYKREGAQGMIVAYTFPIQGFNANSYNMYRNYYYDIHATIKHRGDFDYTPSLTVDVAKWDIANSGEIDLGGTVFTHFQKWEEETILGDVPNEVRVGNNGRVTLDFTLAFPKGAIWTAHLTNNVDFEFDVTDGGVREGFATEGIQRKICVKPLRAVSTNNVSTELFITVFNGQQSAEIDINDLNHTPIAGKRFIIRQIPN